ncbi:hypothetical protein BH09PAT3_BH09PAT3_1850 [soil metagenome]
MRPFNATLEKLFDYYTTRLNAKQPVLLDTFKTEQWMKGRVTKKSKPEIFYIDHDIHVAHPSEDSYSDYDQLLVLEFVVCQAAIVTGFMANTSKSPRVKNGSIFNPAVENCLAFLHTLEQADSPLPAFKNYTSALRIIVADIYNSPAIDNASMHALGNVRQQLGDLRVKAYAASI